jgi:plasmid stability protein
MRQTDLIFAPNYIVIDIRGPSVPPFLGEHAMESFFTEISIVSIMEEIGGKMATLNVKNIPDSLYRKLQAQAKREHRSVAQHVTWLLSRALNQPPRLSILELKGLGKEHWRDVDAAEHVARERDAWD